MASDNMIRKQVKTLRRNLSTTQNKVLVINRSVLEYLLEMEDRATNVPEMANATGCNADAVPGDNWRLS